MRERGRATLRVAEKGRNRSGARRIYRRHGVSAASDGVRVGVLESVVIGDGTSLLRAPRWLRSAVFVYGGCALLQRLLLRRRNSVAYLNSVHILPSGRRLLDAKLLAGAACAI